MLALRLFRLTATTAVPKQSSTDSENYTYSLTDYPRIWPIEKTPRVLLFHDPQILHYGLDDDAEWKALAPGDGIVYLGENKEPFSISMFHQLRCIDIIRQAIVRRGRGENAPMELARHCMGYLRQMILCRADTYADADALEDYVICDDWERVYAAVEANQKTVFK